MATLGDAFVQPQMSNQRKSQKEGHKPSGKGGQSSGKEDSPKSCFHLNSAEHLRNQCPELKETKPHISAVVPETGAPEDPAGWIWNLDMEFIKVAGVNNKESVGQRDTGAQISLVEGSVVQKTDRLPDQTVGLLVAGCHKIPIPLAKVPVEWEGLEVPGQLGCCMGSLLGCLLG